MAVRKVAIVLRGVKNVGKTTTIKKVYDLILRKYPTATVEKYNVNTIDITVIIRIGDIEIGIESQGDPGERPRKRINESFRIFKNKNVQIIICASHLKGQTVELIKALTSDYQEEEIIKEKCMDSTMYDSMNLEIANNIVEKVEKIISALD